MARQWNARAERGTFSEEEFERGVQEFLDFEAAYVKGVGTDILGALRTGDVVLPEAERKALGNAKANLDAWHRALWSAYDALEARGANNVASLDDHRRRLRSRAAG